MFVSIKSYFKQMTSCTCVKACTLPLDLFRPLFYLLSAFVLLRMSDWMGHEHPSSLSGISSLIHYFFIGIFAAVVANSTGAGGGIVFIPAFMKLGMSATESLATSIAIQCFGMTSGALAWISFKNKGHSSDPTAMGEFFFYPDDIDSCILGRHARYAAMA